MEIKELFEGLHPLERKVLPFLENESEVSQIIEKSKMQEIEVLRALQWLNSKKLIVLKEELKELVFLQQNGREYQAKGLPERRLLDVLKEKEISIDEIEKKTHLSKEEISIALGALRSKACIEITKKEKLMIKLTQQGKQFLQKDFPEEKLLDLEFPIDLMLLNSEQKSALESLRKRKQMVSVEIKKIRQAKITELGEELLNYYKKNSSEDIIEKITPELMKGGEWKNKSLRRFDVSINVPKIYGGKFQHYRRFLDSVRRKFMSLGFKEMNGPLVETDFWDMDALFMPQFHSARDIHQAYYIKEPKQMNIDKEVLNKVKEAHENGGKTGSSGWQYKFDVERTKRTLLRTQGTVCSAKMLTSKDLKIPGKYFGITRVFRYDTIDATHLPDFNQTEGIVIEEGLNIRHLFGLLKMFAKEFAQTDKIRIVPGYFPFTEPSAELFAKHPELGWIELGGAGIFRPEVVTPLLGKNISVLAWGLGIDRLGMFNLGIKDIRELFSHNIEILRNAKVV